MLTRESILDILREIPDPEMPISIVDLGLVHDVRIDDACGAVAIDLLPTFVGCPALDMIADQVRGRVGAMTGVNDVRVKWLFDPPWTVDRISELGRASLKHHGVTVPERCGNDLPASRATIPLRTSAIPCPFCGSSSTRLDSPFGPTRCRMIYYCEACRNTFEHLKRVTIESATADERG